MARRIVLETVATTGRQCPPPFPGMALHGASHEVLQENSLGVSSLYRGHKEGAALVCLPSLKRQRVNVNHATRQKPWSPTAPTDLCFAPWVLSIHFRWHLCLLVSSAQGSDPSPPTQPKEATVFPRGLALWENCKNLSGWKSLGEAWRFWRVPRGACLHAWWQLPRSTSQTRSEAPWLQRSRETLRKALSPQLTVKGAEGGTAHQRHSPLYRHAVSQFVFHLTLPA